MPNKIYNRFLYIHVAPSSGCLLVLFKLNLKMFQWFSDVWSENAPLLKRLIQMHSNPPIL